VSSKHPTPTGVVPSKKLNVTQQYTKRIVEQIETADVFSRYATVERLLQQYFQDRLTEFEADIDDILAVSQTPAKNVAEVKARSGKRNMRVPGGN
jgi:hypothetical protein